jgi:hypothetical protein
MPVGCSAAGENFLSLEPKAGTAFWQRNAEVVFPITPSSKQRTDWAVAYLEVGHWGNDSMDSF